MADKSRYKYTMRDERLMWEHVYEKLQADDPAAKQPKGLKLWQDFEATLKTNKTASSLATHFRREMYEHIEDAELPVERVLFIASQLNLQLFPRQRRKLEHRWHISIKLNGNGHVTEYEKDGKIYLPGSLKRRNSSSESDSDIDEELGYDAILPLGTPPKVEKQTSECSTEKESPVAPRSSRSLKSYNLRSNSKVPVTAPKRENSETIVIEEDSEDNTDQSENQKEKEESKGDQQLSDDGGSDDLLAQNMNSSQGSGHDLEQRATPNKIEGGQLDENKKVDARAGSLREKLERSSVVMVRTPKVAWKNFAAPNQQAVEKTSDGVSGNDVVGKASDEISGSAASRSNSSSTASSSNIAPRKRKVLVDVCRTVDDELNERLARIEGRLTGIEKMKAKKILEFRAKEAKRLGCSLEMHLKKIARQKSEADSESSSRIC